jgi:import inner membrane translocase subunit TIM21
MRTTARTTNLGVILLGAGLSVLLIYSLSSELFSKNSPTVLYGNACERINQSEHVLFIFIGYSVFKFWFQLANYLNGPLTFHNNPPSSVRPRHRNRHVNSRIMIDQYGQEHMVMTFFVQGRPDGETIPPSEKSFFDSATTWVQDKAITISECSFDDALSSLKECAKNAWNKSIVAFKYLSGDPLPPPPLPTPQQFHNEVKKNSTSAWSFAGIFSSLKGQRGSISEAPSKSIIGNKFTEGEVHADLVKVSLCTRFRVIEAIMFCCRIKTVTLSSGIYS